MKKIILVSVLLLLSCFLFAKPFTTGSTLYVSAKNVKLRKTEAALSQTISTIYYGDSCIVLESNNKNTKVQLNSDKKEEGWISNGSLTKKKITSSTRTSARASADELAMAGKGFSAQAEQAFKQSNSDLNYDLINEIETISISNNEVLEFIEEGHLKGGNE